MKFSLEEILEATGAHVLRNELKDDEKFTFSTDTRMIKAGEIYLPLKGENFDGEKFIDKALEAGAAGYFISKQETVNGKRNVPLILQVENTLVAYLEMARFYRRKIAPKTIAITGSSGKTTTKEMAYCVALEKFKTHKSELNFNNEVGLCKTILSMPEDTQVLIVEMGMRGLGEIELLSKYAEPDIAIIANVGTAHIGRLGSKENIALAKCEIVRHMNKSGILIAHDDKIIRATLCARDNSSTRFFDLSAVKILERKIGYSRFEYKNHEYELNIEGDYNIQNSLAVIEMGLQLGMSKKEIAAGLKKYSPIEKRWEVQEIKGFKIINDSYNANPESMKATIKTVLDIYPPPILFVLGDMGELGVNEVEYHQEIGEFLVGYIKSKKQSCHCEHGVNDLTYAKESTCRCDAPPRNDVIVLTVGGLANEISKKLEANGIPSINFDDNLQTSRYILDNIRIGTTIVLKASRSMKFEEIIDEVKNKE